MRKKSDSSLKKQTNVVPPTDLRVEVIGWLLLCWGRDWLLRGFPLLWVPASSGGDGGRVINYSAAIWMDERLACQIKFIREQKPQ